MTCGHKLSFRKTYDLISASPFKTILAYTCECGKKCELEVKPLCHAAGLAAAIVVTAAAEALLRNLYGRYYMFNALLFLAGLAVGVAAWIGALYGLYRLNAFKYAAVEDYKPIVDRQKLSRR